MGRPTSNMDGSTHNRWAQAHNGPKPMRETSINRGLYQQRRGPEIHNWRSKIQIYKGALQRPEFLSEAEDHTPEAQSLHTRGSIKGAYIRDVTPLILIIYIHAKFTQRGINFSHIEISRANRLARPVGYLYLSSLPLKIKIPHGLKEKYLKHGRCNLKTCHSQSGKRSSAWWTTILWSR